MNKAHIGDKFSASIEVARALIGGLKVKTVWDFECFDKYGNLKWQELQRPNIITTQGLNSLLDVYLDAATQVTAWYIGPVETDTVAALTQTYAVPVFTEWDGYTEAARQALVMAAASGGVSTNTASKATFTASETKTLYGAALFGGGTDASTMSNTAGGGTLFCYSKFSSAKEVESGDIFKVTLTVTIANAA
jgi:hypothetical protein